MISIEITNSPDKDMNGIHSFYFDEIVIGSKLSCSLVINDNSLEKKHITLKVNESQVFCAPISKSTYYLSNGKKISGRKLHKAGDIITIGSTDIKIISFEDSTKESSSLNENYNNAISSFPSSEKLFDELEKEFILIEKMPND